jgi:hypothetical protein
LVAQRVEAIRIAAGAVRDMGVLAADALTLAGHHCDEAILLMLQHFSTLRPKKASRLEDF